MRPVFTSRPSRRSFTGSLAAAALARPFLRVLGVDPLPIRRAEAASTPKRVVWIYIPDGVVNWNKEIGTPNGADFNIGTSIAPLAPLKSDVTILDGMTYRHKTDADKHTLGMVLYLTGNPFQVSCSGNSTCVVTGNTGGVLNPSIDQYLASKMAGLTPFNSLQLGIQPFGGFSISFSGAGKGTALPPDPDPVAAYGRVFSGARAGAAPDPAATLRLKLRKSVLDNVLVDLNGLNSRLGGDDRKKLDQHMASIREMERRLTALPTAGCGKATPPTAVNLNDANLYGPIAQSHFDLLANAFACDLTRIATVQFRACYSRGGMAFAPVNVAVDVHRQSHLDGTDEAGYGRGKAWHYQQVADFATKLKSIREPDGNGTLLDNTLIITSSDIAQGHVHTRMPFVLIGGKNLGVRTGRLVTLFNGKVGNDVSSTGEPHVKLWVSILNIFGVPDTSFANTTYGTGPLADFTA